MRTMTKKELQEDNLKLQEKVKDTKLRDLLVKISKLSIPELSDFLELDKQKKSTQQIKMKKKIELSQEQKKMKEMMETKMKIDAKTKCAL